MTQYSNFQVFTVQAHKNEKALFKDQRTIKFFLCFDNYYSMRSLPLFIFSHMIQDVNLKKNSV